MSAGHDPNVIAILDSHLYYLRNIANKRLEILTDAGCFFCGRAEPEIVKQYLCNTIFRFPVCVDCDEKGYEPMPEDYEKHG